MLAVRTLPKIEKENNNATGQYHMSLTPLQYDSNPYIYFVILLTAFYRHVIIQKLIPLSLHQPDRL